MQHHDMARVSFNIPIEEHIELKSECAKARIKMKDFFHEWILIGLKELKKQQLHKDLLQGFKDIEEGKGIPLTDEFLNEWGKELEDHG